METLGGGWERAINLDTSDGQVQKFGEYGFWQAHSSTGDVAHRFGGDFKSGDVFSTPHKDLLIVVHRNGAPVGWRAWGLSAERSLRSYVSAEPSRNAVKIASSVLGADVASIEATEPTVRPAGGLFVNQIWGTALSFDVARLRSDTFPSTDNVNGGIGIAMDAQQNGGLQSQPVGDVYPGCDAGSTLPWSQYLCIGTDRDCSNCGELVGGTRELAYDYAIWAK